MEINRILLGQIESLLGKGKSTARGNYAFFCPNKSHSKPKLEINFDEASPHYQSYQCWSCGEDFKGKKLIHLLKSINLSTDKINSFKPLLKGDNSSYKIELSEERIELPKEFIPLSRPNNSFTYKQALSYLSRRGVNKQDILKYNIGYCEYGSYKDRIIIPSYDEKGILNYFTARAINEHAYIKYKNPQISRDIIPFELFINWNLPIVLCEGAFDALAIKRNVIPLFGKNIQNNLMKKISQSIVRKIYVALDKDALKQSLNHCEKLLNEGKKVYLVEMEQKDPAELGFENFTNLIQKAIPLTFSSLLAKKLEL